MPYESFFTCVIEYLVMRGFTNTPSWDQWCEIRNLLHNGKRVEAIKELRIAAFKYETETLDVPTGCMQDSDFTRFVVGRATKQVLVRLDLREAKSIIDWLKHKEHVFNHYAN